MAVVLFLPLWIVSAAESQESGLECIGSGQAVAIEAAGRKELSGTFVVDASGKIRYPALGEIFVTGLTPGELKEYLVDSLKKNNLSRSPLTVKIVETPPVKPVETAARLAAARPVQAPVAAPAAELAQITEDKRLVFAAGFMGFLSGIALCSLLKFLSGWRVRTARDMQAAVSLPFLGSVPFVKELSGKSHASAIEALKVNRALANTIAGIRTRIFFSMPSEKSQRVLFTSSVPGEGKSVFAALLGISLAESGKKTLLIDADLRKPSLHRYLGMGNAKGLSDFLSGGAPVEDVVCTVLKNDAGQLAVITGGGSVPNHPSELLASERFGTLLKQVSANFDHVLVDVPPVLPLPDGLIAAKQIMTGILVGGSGKVSRKTLQTVKDKFDSIGHSFTGTLLTQNRLRA